MCADLSKEKLYEGVKTLVESNSSLIHLPQHKLYTLTSVGFQYLLYLSTKSPGHYILRVENSYLLDKIQRNAKDMSTRKFFQKLAIPRKLKFGNSWFHLDFFHLGSWAQTSALPKEKIKGVLIIKNASKSPIDILSTEDETEERKIFLQSLPEDYYLTSLQEISPLTVVIAFDEKYEGFKEISFPFIKENSRENALKGVSIASDIDASKFD